MRDFKCLLLTRNRGIVMLILSRAIGDSIMVGDDVEVKLLKIEDGRAVIGVNAPKEISVHRHEIYERIQRQKCSSTTDLSVAEA